MNSSACEKPSARSRRILSAQKSLEYHKHKKIHHDSLSSRKACLSATSSSLRLLHCERRRSLDSIQNAAKGLCIEPKEFIPPKMPHHPCIFEDQKVFLQGSQMLEKLNQILKQNLQTNDDLSNPSSPSREFDAELYGQKFTKQNTKRLIFYYDQLKKLLIERCLLILKGQCSDHIFQSRKFLEESMSFALTERIKIKAIPSKARNPFIDSSHIDINNLYFLVEKLNATSDMWFSLVQNFQRIISLFHVGYDIQLHQLLCSTNVVLKNLLYKIFYWVRFNLDINIQKLCRSDPSTVSSEFLQSILDVCKSFNALLVEKQQQGFGPFCYSNSILNFCNSNRYVAEMSSSNILNYLSGIESSIVAERIVRFLMSESQKELKISTKNKLTAKWIPKEFQHKYMQQDSSTSDYYSASASETENTLNDGLDKTYKVQMQPLEGLAPSVASVISVLLQRNQALVLKYLFAVMCLNNSPSKTSKSGGFRGNVMQPSRALWKLPLHHYSNKTCTFLERVYWSHFWQQVEESIFKLMTEVSHHHYGDMLPGPIALWPDALLCAMMNILKQCIQDDEICKEAQQLMKHVYFYLFSTAAYISWDERFLIALSVTQSYRCPAVPVAEGLVCTNPGNLLCSAIEPLIGLLLITIPAEEYTYAVKALQQLQCSVNYLFLWFDVRKRAFLSSWNISSYLLVSCADTKQACLLLSYVKHLSLPKLNQVKKRTHSFITCQRMWKILCQQICDLKNSLQDVPPLVYQKTYELATDILKHSLPGSCIWSMCKKVSPSTKTYVQELIDTILLPVFDTVICLPNPMPVSNSVINAIAHAWLASLRNRKLKLSVNNAQQLHHDVCQIIAWIEQSNLHKKEKDCLKEMKSVQQLQSVAEWLSSLKPHSGPSCLIYNRVVPVGSEVEYSSQRLSNMLTETEKDNWRKIHSCSSSFLSRCIGCT